MKNNLQISSDMEHAMTVDQVMHSGTTRTGTRIAFRAAALDSETARDIQVKLALAAEARKQGLKHSAQAWLSAAAKSLDEFKESQTAA